MNYDKNNVFYKIIHKEIPADIVLEGDHYIAIKDINPRTPVHILLIPKGNYVDYEDFASNATPEEIVNFHRGIGRIVEMMNLRSGGFKLLSNAGPFVYQYIEGQQVMHMHLHILGG
ncbi:MAG: HIT domain-containing protein [Holosporales bacterium]|jgi:histidine triad (HIT) family protein|nr:HIT domain-containing protein [Holosporales bacterium]